VGTGVVHTALYGTAPRRVFVLAIKDNGLFSAKDTCKDSITTQQVAIYETTNIVEVYIERKNLCHGNSNAYAILGLHNYAGSKAVVAPGRNYPVIWTATNEAWRWMPIGPKAYTTAWYVVGNPIPISNDDSLTLCSQAQCTVSYVARTTYRNCNGVEVTVSDTVTVAGGSNAAEFQSDPNYPAELFIPNTTVNFHNDAPADSPRHWDFGNGDESTAPNPSHTFPAPGTYFVTLVVGYDGANCNDTVTHGPYVVKMPELSVPNVFSPNADGINDFFLVQYTGSESFFCAIYDRWGILQWSTNNKLQGWNGDNGRGPVPDGVYFYRLRIGERDFSGELTLLR
jgi:gliding motility-associated-like protein